MPTIARPSSSQPDGAMARPSRSAPPPRVAAYRVPVGLVDHEPDERSVVIEHADARGVEGHAAVRIGRPVDRVDDREQPRGAVARQPRLLRADGQAGAVQDRQRGVVGRQIEAVLPRPRARRPPVLEVVERSTYGDDGLVQHFDQAGLVHPLTIEGDAGARPAVRTCVSTPVCGAHLGCSRLVTLWLPSTSPATWPT